MATFTAIPDEDLDAETVGTTGVFTKLRDNIVALYENTRILRWKAANEGPVNDNTYQSDDDLWFTTGADMEYEFEMMLLVATTAVADFKFRFTQPGAGVNTYASFEAYRADAVEDIGWLAIETGQAINYGGDVLNALIFVNGNFIIDGAGGTIQLQWAQQNNTPLDDTWVVQGSWLKAHRCDLL